MTITFILTIWLMGMPIWTDPKPYPQEQEALCKQDGRKKVADYRRDHLMVQYSCDPQQ